MVNRVKYSFILVLLPYVLLAQELKQLSLEQAYELSQKNYPVIRQKDLVHQIAAINIENLRKGFLPQVNLSAQASYQSDVTRIPISIPGFTVEQQSKDQYKVLADLSQLVYDGGITKEQKILQQLNAKVEDQKIEVELYQVRNRVNQFYLGVLYIDEQLKQTTLVKSDIQIGIKVLEVRVQNGVAFRSNLNVLRAESLKTDQRIIDLKATRKGLLDGLSLFLGQPIDTSIVLKKPSLAVVIDSDIRRPELQLYEDQSKLIGQQTRLIEAKNLPKASLFAQGGYGRPGLNLLNNDFDFYYLGGVRLNWSLGGLYTRKKEKQLVEVNKKIVEIQKQTFVLNTETDLKQQQAEIDRLIQLMATDEEIISLRKSVTEAARAQLENGVITATDYLREINEADQARQLLAMHQVQLLQAQINYKTISGK